MASLSYQEQTKLLEACKTFLLEHCSKINIAVEFIPDDPSQAGQFRVCGYGTYADAMGLLAVATEKTKHELWQNFHNPPDDEQETTA